MKTALQINRSQRRQGGVAVIVMLVLLSLIVAYVAANIRTLNFLQKELKLTEQRQIRRLNAMRPPVELLSITNAAVTVTNQPSEPSVNP